MIVEAVQMRKVDHISPEAPNQAKRAIAQFLNEYSYAKNGPLKLHFAEEVNDRGVPQGHPAMRDLTGANIPKKRRASVASAVTGGLIKDKQAKEQFEISMSGATARKYSVTGNHVGQAKAPPPSGRRGSVTDTDMPAAGPPPGARGGVSGRRGSVVSAGGPMMPPTAPPSGRRASVSSSSGGRRASVSIGEEEHAGVIKYLVLEKATVRAGPASSSPKIGEHKKGAVIDVIQESIDDRGLQVLLTHTAPDGATQGGWVKLVTSKGKHLLERIGSAEDLGFAQPSARGGRRGSVSSATGSIDGAAAAYASRGGRRGSITSVGSGQGGRRGSVTSEGSYDGGAVLTSGGAVLTSATSFEVKYEFNGKNTKFEVIVEPEQIVFNNLKTQSLHLALPYAALRTNNYARVVSGGVVIGFPGGKDMFLTTNPTDATQISELVHRAKEHADWKLDRAERRKLKAQEQQSQQEDTGGNESEDDPKGADAFDASPATFRNAFKKYKPGDKVDVDSEDGWEYGATVLGPAKGGNDDEMQIRFADGVVDDWPISDFRRVELAEEGGGTESAKEQPKRNVEGDLKEDSQDKRPLSQRISADLEDTIPEAVDDRQQELISAKAVATTQKQKEQAPNELIGFLNRCGIDDEAVHEAFVAYGVQSEEDLSELVEEDFARIGLNTVQKRRLMRTLRGNPSTSSNVPTPPEAEPPAVAPKTLPAPASTTAVVPGTVEEAEPPSSAKQDSPSMNVYISPFLKGPEIESEILRVKKLIPATVREAQFFRVSPDTGRWYSELHETDGYPK